jgi:hypothetical protein
MRKKSIIQQDQPETVLPRREARTVIAKAPAPMRPAIGDRHEMTSPSHRSKRLPHREPQLRVDSGRARQIGTVCRQATYMPIAGLGRRWHVAVGVFGDVVDPLHLEPTLFRAAHHLEE